MLQEGDWAFLYDAYNGLLKQLWARAFHRLKNFDGMTEYQILSADVLLHPQKSAGPGGKSYVELSKLGGISTNAQWDEEFGVGSGNVNKVLKEYRNSWSNYDRLRMVRYLSGLQHNDGRPRHCVFYAEIKCMRFTNAELYFDCYIRDKLYHTFDCEIAGTASKAQ